MVSREFQIGDWVVFRRTKFSKFPGKRAHDVAPQPRGESYTYVVDKLWVVADIDDAGKLVLVTRRGKRHSVSPSNGNLRPAAWWEKLKYRRRFEEAAESATQRGRVAVDA
ncbi:MAG: hypothetical protein ACYTGL_21740 [Planctomycetota bacterium]|jgi:hypothetical protein